MKHVRQFIVAVCLVLVGQGASAQDQSYGMGHPFGLGIIIGEPTGLSAKYWLSGSNALDFGLGWSSGGDRISRFDGTYNGGGRVHFHMDYLWHSFDAINSTQSFPLYYGIGGRFNNGGGYSSSLAIRGVIGIAWLPRGTPIDVFLEIAPSLQLSPSSGFALDAGLGVRYFF